MRFSWSWLRDYVELPPASLEEGQKLADRLTAAGLAVEYVEVEGDDVVLDIDVTTNRVDAMNHFGLAREIAVLLDRPLRFPETTSSESGEAAAEAVRVVIEDERCLRYAVRVLRGVRVGPSPDWLVARLATVGVRSINNVVDVTNFVLWELGQPLHAFDLATIAGGTIHVRTGRDGEVLKTLDGVERKLDPDQIVIADDERAVGLGGVMGGLDTEVTAATTDLLIESAHFSPQPVRRTAKKHGLKTDASHRFERGADPEMCAFAADRAARLIQELAGGTVLTGVVDVRVRPVGAFRLSGQLELARLDRFIGVSVPRETVERWYVGLGFELLWGGKGGYGISVPSWRYYDFHPTRPDGSCYEADLFEEIARLHGLDGIPATLPAISGIDQTPQPELLRRRAVAQQLASAGYAEAINFAFHDPKAAATLPTLRPTAGALTLANPLSASYSEMRRSLLPGLVESARFNVRRGAPCTRLFEIGRVFFGREGELFPDEVEMVALVAGGTLGLPWERAAELDLYDLKGVLDSLAEVWGVAYEVRPAAVHGFLAGTGAEIHAGGELVGVLGRVDGDDPYPLFVAELVLATLGAGQRLRPVSLPSRFPGVTADLTLTHRVEVSWAEIAGTLEALRPQHLATFSHKDRYQGPGVPAGAVNTTISFAYGAADRSLTQDEVNVWQTALAEELQRRFGVG